MTEIEKIQEQIDGYRKEIKRLNDIILKDKEKDFVEKVTLIDKFYKFTYDYIDYYGIITNFWYSSSDDKYVMFFCGFGGEFTVFADANWFVSDVQRIFYIKPFELRKFLDTFEEITEEQFWTKHQEMLKQSKLELEDWILFYQNKKEDEEE